jgi:cytochrome c oxidase subunit I
VLSAVVYGHHMFVTGMSPLLGQGFMLLTLIISVPAEVLFLNWLHTIWKGSIRATSPMLFSLGMIFVFGLGGLTGIFLGTISTDLYLHDTMFVVGHFHYTMAAASFLASFAGIYFWFPKMFGKQMNETLAKIHFWPTIIGITLVFGGQMIAGYSGQQRRLYDPYQYTYLQHLKSLNMFTSYAAFFLGISQLVFIYNFFVSVFAGKKAEQNPWEVGTLEWELPSPPKYHNFDVVPTVLRGPHEYANPEALKHLGRDYLTQTEELPAEAATLEKSGVAAE